MKSQMNFRKQRQLDVKNNCNVDELIITKRKVIEYINEKVTQVDPTAAWSNHSDGTTDDGGHSHN